MRSFVARLSREEVKEFVLSQYPTDYGYTVDLYWIPKRGENDTWVVVLNNIITGGRWKFKLQDFYSGDEKPVRWYRYLYKKFGSEYYNAYRAYAMSIFDNLDMGV